MLLFAENMELLGNHCLPFAPPPPPGHTSRGSLPKSADLKNNRPRPGNILKTLQVSLVTSARPRWEVVSQRAQPSRRPLPTRDPWGKGSEPSCPDAGPAVPAERPPGD